MKDQNLIDEAMRNGANAYFDKNEFSIETIKGISHNFTIN